MVRHMDCATLSSPLGSTRNWSTPGLHFRILKVPGQAPQRCHASTLRTRPAPIPFLALWRPVIACSASSNGDSIKVAVDDAAVEQGLEDALASRDSSAVSSALGTLKDSGKASQWRSYANVSRRNLNDILSLGLHRVWKRMIVTWSRVLPSPIPDLASDDTPNWSLASASVGAAVTLFLFTRIAGAEPALNVLAAEAVPYDQAMAGARPVMVEFYADWCEVCRQMARDVRRAEAKFRDKVEFVMINVDDPKFSEELDEFGVDGIPHFVFLDKDKNEQGFVVGRMPRRVLGENLAALAEGADSIPHSQLVGTFSEGPAAAASLPLGNELQEASLREASLPQSDDATVANINAADDAASLGAPSGTASLLGSNGEVEVSAPSFYDFEVENIKGEKVSLSEYRGQVALVVNVASRCGLTDSNYKGLTKLYDRHKEEGFVILGFPCNQFLGQEPGNNEQIEEFACSRYKATFPLFSKVEVNGPSTAPVYRFLKAQAGEGRDISWNFEKFLVDRSGHVVGRYAPSVSPLDLEDKLRTLL